MGLAASSAAQELPPVLITEFKAVNNGPVTDEELTFSDWIELYNPTSDTVNLEGWFLTDLRGNLRQWSFPATNLPPRSFMLVFASGRDQRVPGRPPQAAARRLRRMTERAPATARCGSVERWGSR